MSEYKSVPERLLQLADYALKQTRAGELSWRATDDPDAFMFSGPKTSLIIDAYPATGEFYFRLLNATGTVVESMDSTMSLPAIDLSTDPRASDASPVRSTHSVLADLHDAARRNALDIDGILNQAFTDVEKPNEPPF